MSIIRKAGRNGRAGTSASYAFTCTWFEIERQRVVADFGRWHQIPLVAVAPGRFESRDGLVRLRYEADEQVERIVVSYSADGRGRYVDVC